MTTAKTETRDPAATAPALPGVPDGIHTADVIRQMIRRAASPSFDAWWKKAEDVGFCANPIHLIGTDTVDPV
jgi:hypothetical protein